MNKFSKNIFRLCSVILSIVLTFLYTSNAIAAEQSGVKTKELLFNNTDSTEFKSVEIYKTALSEMLDTINDTDGFNENELKQLSEVADIKIEESTQNDLQITDYILQSKSPLAKITIINGETEYLQQKNSLSWYC